MKIAFVGTNSTNIVSRLIKWFTNSNWTHAMLILDDTIDGDAIVIEASASHGIQLSLLSKFKNRPMEVFQDKNDIWDINPIKRYIGNNYGYLQLLGVALVKLFKLEKNPFICTLLQKATLHKFDNGMYISFEEPQSAITEGQFAAWHIDDELIGSGVIS